MGVVRDIKLIGVYYTGLAQKTAGATQASQCTYCLGLPGSQGPVVGGLPADAADGLQSSATSCLVFAIGPP